MTLVGLVVNLKYGFQVVYDVLKETNQKVTKILGKDLVLANRLADRSETGNLTLGSMDDMLNCDLAGTMALDTADIEALGLTDPKITAVTNCYSLLHEK